MKVQCTVCKKFYRIKSIERAQIPLICKSCRPPHGKPWTKEEVDNLKRLRKTTTLSIPDIADILGMTEKRVMDKIGQLKLKKPKKADTYGERKTVNDVVMVKTTKVDVSVKKMKSTYKTVWIPLKDLTWFVLCGEIPEGYRVKIIDLEKPQDSIENLELTLK